MKNSSKSNFRKGQKVSYFDDMTNTMKVGFILKKMKNQYLVGPTKDYNMNYADRAFDTTRGEMSLID